MQDKAKRDKLILELCDLRRKRKNETDPQKEAELLNRILDIQDELLILEFDGDRNIKRFNRIKL